MKKLLSSMICVNLRLICSVLAPIFLLFFLLVTANTEASAKTIDLQIQPGLENIRPLSKPARLTLTLRDGAGKAIDRTRFQIRLYAPPRGLFFSTDFPQVEGTPLIEIESPAFQGKIEWEYVFPIRGVYRLEVSAVDGVGDRVKQVFPLRIRESRTKLVYLGTFLAGLFLFALMVGRLFTPRGRETHIAVGLLWLAGSVLSIFPAMAQELTTKVPGDKEFLVRLEVSPPTVGQPSEIHWRLSEKETGMPYPTHLTLAITQLEKGKRIFFLKQIPTDGNLAFKFHFVDGSPHRVSSIAELKGRNPIRVEKVVAVTGIEPPKAVSLRALVLFLGVLVLGLITGRMSHRWKKR
ncbi:MAG: hypothetical protein IH796_10005 [Deltaproteobacteria bacterium]|nr:hypothetical protein [Deltaproteobacteria bacterium]